MTPLTLRTLCDRLISLSHPLIVMHTRPDGDTIGSAAALSHLLRLLGKSPRTIAPDPIPRRLAFLIEGLDLITLPFDDQPYETVTVDVASLGQLGSLRDTLVGDLFPRIMIDHHGRGEAYADSYVKADASATGEIVYELALAMLSNGLISHLPLDLLTCIYAAISSDTGCFRFSNTTPLTHTIAADLISRGVNAAEINRLLFDVKSAEQLRAEGYVQSNLRLHPSKRIASIVITREIRESLGLLDEHFETAIDVVRSLEGVEIAIAIKESPDGRFKASLRSTGADVSAVAASLGGGGHIRAAGCSIAANDATEAAQTVIEAAWEAIKPL